jgi:hypothetical protein
VMISAFILALVTTETATVDRHGLYVVPRAVDVDRTILKLPDSVHYYVPERYPADETLGLINRSLKSAGWRTATCDDLGEYTRSSHTDGWQELPSNDGSLATQLWSGMWMNAEGDTIHYSLIYRAAAPGDLQPTHVEVGAWYETREQAEQGRNASDRLMDELRAKHPFLRDPKPCRSRSAGEE